MNRWLRYFKIARIALILIPSCLLAQVQEQPDYKNFKKVAQTGFQFLKIGVDARSAAMANIGVTHSGDAANLFANPAGLGHVESKSVFVGYNGWIADMNKQAAGFAINLDEWGVIGISGANMGLGDIQGTAVADNPLGYVDTEMLDVAEWSLGISYAKQLSNKFTVGGTIKNAYQNLHDESKSMIGFDFGTIYEPGWNGVKVGMVVRNFSGEFKYIQETLTLPTVFSVGFSGDVLQFLGAGSEQYQWIAALEMNNPRDYSERVHVGTEFVLNQLIALRGGYKFNYDEQGLTLGAGLQYNFLRLDYSYLHFGEIFGSVNQFSASFNF
ncbi:PorV/PorQ family protein [candidate division KSB1 bacterium]|nr:PorV/PorQ family protein [candidate division KSB1 bacterium]